MQKDAKTSFQLQCTHSSILPLSTNELSTTQTMRIAHPHAFPNSGHSASAPVNRRELSFNANGHVQEKGDRNTFTMNAQGNFTCHGNRNTIQMNGDGDVTAKGNRNTVNMNGEGDVFITGARNSITLNGSTVKPG